MTTLIKYLLIFVWKMFVVFIVGAHYYVLTVIVVLLCYFMPIEYLVLTTCWQTLWIMYILIMRFNFNRNIRNKWNYFPFKRYLLIQILFVVTHSFIHLKCQYIVPTYTLFAPLEVSTCIVNHGMHNIMFLL